MKKILLLSSLLFVSTLAEAQTAETQVKFNKTNQNAYVVQYAYEADILQQALEQRLKKSGITGGKTRKGFVTYEGVNWPEISADKVDIYYNIAGKKENATATFLVSKGYDNFVSTASDAAMSAKIIQFMNSLGSEAKTVYHTKMVLEQTLKVKEVEESLSKLKAEEEKLEKELKKNREEQDKSNKNREQEKRKLDELMRNSVISE